MPEATHWARCTAALPSYPLAAVLLAVCAAALMAGCGEGGEPTAVDSGAVSAESALEAPSSDDPDGESAADAEIAADDAGEEGQPEDLGCEPGDDKWPAHLWPEDPIAPNAGGQVITFGQSAALGGPARALGQGMQQGVRIAFYEQNSRREDGLPGIGGYALRLLSLNDCYEPGPALANTKSLIGDHGVLALIGATGTPTSEVAAPEAARSGVPYIGPFTGAGILRDSVRSTNVVNFRASYVQETYEMVKRLKEDLGISSVAVVFQDDSYGRAGYVGVVEALKEEHGNEPTAIAYYTRNTTIVRSAVLDLQAGEPEPEAVIIIGAYRPTAELIRWSRKLDFDPIFMSVSFVGTNALVEEFKDDIVGFDVNEDGIEDISDGVGVYITQVVPFPYDLPETGVQAEGTVEGGEAGDQQGDYDQVVQAYHSALNRYNEEHAGAYLQPGFVSFEGYLAGRLAIEGLKACDVSLDLATVRDCLLNRIISSEEPITIDGFELDFSDGPDPDNDPDFNGFDNQGSNKVFITRINAYGDLDPVTNLSEHPPEYAGPRYIGPRPGSEETLSESGETASEEEPGVPLSEDPDSAPGGLGDDPGDPTSDGQASDVSTASSATSPGGSN